MYELKGQKRGTYILVYFTAPGAAVSAIERDVNLSEEVLRVLVTKADHLNKEEMEKVEPQPIQPREERSFDRNPWDAPSRPRRDDRAPEGAGKE
jgi:small subunit ribosomal protein S6